MPIMRLGIACPLQTKELDFAGRHLAVQSERGLALHSQWCQKEGTTIPKNQKFTVLYERGILWVKGNNI
jgi:hypothetical protein